MTSAQVRQALREGEDINEMLVGQYIGDFVKELHLGEYQVVVLHKPITSNLKSNPYGTSHNLVGIHADGRYIFNPELKPKTGILQFGLSIVDVLEFLEKGQYNIY